MSVHSPRICRGRKSSSQPFDVPKSAVAVDPPPGSTATAGVSWRCCPATRRMPKARWSWGVYSEQFTGLPATAAIADATYGDGHSSTMCPLRARPDRQCAHAAGPNPLSQEVFKIDMPSCTYTCPAGPVQRGSQDRCPAPSHRYGRQPGPDPSRHLHPHSGTLRDLGIYRV